MFQFRKSKSIPAIFSVQQDGRFGSIKKQTTKPIELLLEKGGSIFEVPHQTLHSAISSKRLTVGLYICFGILFIFLGRSINLQISRGTYYHKLADGNRYHTYTIVSPRGKIFDRNGNILATNIPSFILTMTISGLPKEKKIRDEEFEKISTLVGVQRTDLDLLLTQNIKRKDEHIPVIRGIPHESAMRLSIEIAELPGFDLIASTQRNYPSSVLSLSHILGYAGKISSDEYERLAGEQYRPIDLIGKTGVEQNSERALRGIPGNKIVEINASGSELSVISKTDPTPGFDLILGLDLNFQKYIETRLQDTLMANGAKRGTVIAMDPQTGVIRAMVSLPTYDNNLFASGIDEEQYKYLSEDENLPLFFRGISGEYPSGSIFKPIVAYAALAENVISEHTSFLSTGGIRIGEWFFPDWKSGGHGVTDVRKAIAESVNTFFYIIGGGLDPTVGLGVERIVDYAKRFGFGMKTGIDAPGESDGFLPTKDWKLQVKGERWYVGDTYHLSIGQGDFLTTPIQMAQMTSIFANGGTMHKPHFVEEIQNRNNRTPVEIEASQIQSLNLNALKIVREGMRQTVVSGSAKPLQVLQFPVAGKTGTAQSKVDRPTHAWFTGFGPYENPTLTVTILIEEGGESFTAAVPLAKDVFAWWFAHQQH